MAKFHNEGIRTELQTRLLLMEGLLPGIPDLWVLAARKPFHGLLVEFKRRKGGVVSEAQERIIAHLNAKGYKAVICRGWDEAREATIAYMSGEVW